MISALVRDGWMEAVVYPQSKIFEAAVQLPWAEGKLAAHTIRAVGDEALAAKETGEEKVILFNYCGRA